MVNALISLYSGALTSVVSFAFRSRLTVEDPAMDCKSDTDFVTQVNSNIV